MAAFSWYAEDLQLVLDTIKLLNERGDQSYSEGSYLHIELREKDTHRPIGHFSDEIASDCWAFFETWGEDKKPAET